MNPIKKLYAWITATPNLKGDAYQAAHEWGEAYLEKHLPDGWKPVDGCDPSELIYKHSLVELEAMDDGIKMLNSKCLELMKLLIATVAAVVTAWKLFSSSGTPSIFDWLSNVTALCGIVVFICAMICLASCLRSHDYIPAITTQKLLDWAGEDREHPAYIRMRTAVRGLRALAANRTVNSFIAQRLDIAWNLTVAGFVAIAVGLALQFF